MSEPLIDTTTLVGIESLFRGRKRDPWARQLAGELANIMIYGDLIRCPFPIPTTPLANDPHAEKSSLLADLMRRDSQAFDLLEYSTAEPRQLSDEYLAKSFAAFVPWITSNRETLRRWTDLHHETWVRSIHAKSVQHAYVFSLDRLRRDPTLKASATKSNLSEDDICYAFDTVLKYPLYGELAGEGEAYLNHPIRDAFSLPTMRREQGELPNIAVNFRNTIEQFAEKLSQDEYTVLLHELRGLVRDEGLHMMRPGEFDKEVIREIAAKVRLPPRLKYMTKAVSLAAGLIGGLGAIPFLGPWAAGVGAAVSISAALWSGRLPRVTGRINWLRWTLAWDVEEQAEKRK